MEQNRRLKMSIYDFSHLVFGKDSRKIYDVESKYLQQTEMRKLDVCMQKNEIRPVSITSYKNQLQLDQRPKHETRKCQNKNMSSILYDVEKNIPNWIQFARDLEPIIDQWDFTKLKGFYTTKERQGNQETHRKGDNLCQLNI